MKKRRKGVRGRDHALVDSEYTQQSFNFASFISNRSRAYKMAQQIRALPVQAWQPKFNLQEYRNSTRSPEGCPLASTRAPWHRYISPHTIKVNTLKIII